MIADDTDVLVLLIAKSRAVNADVYMKSDSGGKVVIHNITDIVKSKEMGVCDALPGLHAFTGCESVSSFDKVRAYNLTYKDQRYQQTFADLGKDWKLSANTERLLEAFVCELYGGKHLSDVNVCRYKLFCSKKDDTEPSQLPPCRDCLHKYSPRR